MAPLCDYDSTFGLPFDNSSGFATGMALVNPSDRFPSVVSFVFLDENGAPLLDASLDLKAGD